MAKIRRTRIDDTDLLPEIERSAGSLFRTLPDLAWIADDDVQSAELHRALVQAGCSWVVVDEEDQPIGFLTAEPHPDALHVLEVSVQPSEQGQGMGRALIEQAIEWARAHRLAAVTLTTFRDVPWNESFYRRLGFVTLTTEALPPRLRSILDDEAAYGLPAERRCAMALYLTGETPASSHL